MTCGGLWSGNVRATAERRISTTDCLTRTAGREVHVSGAVRSLCLIAAAAVGCAFASPLATPTRFVSSPQPQPEPKLEIRWRDSRALGTPGAGGLVKGVQLPVESSRFFTWDPVLRRTPNRAWRRWGTDELVRVVVRVARAFAKAYPEAPRLGIGDLSLPAGGYFGPKHATHQNGLDVDVYYPRLDRRERPPRSAAQVDLRLAQDLVDRFLAAGATVIYVGPNTPLRGPPSIVQPLWNHDNHLHVRIAPRP
jgi:murein endopeptidase